MKLKHLLLLSSACAVLAACGATGTPFAGMERPSGDHGRIYVYRANSIVGQGVSYDVYANDALIGHIRKNGYITRELPAGNYEVWGQTESKRGVVVPLQAGAIECVKAGVGIGFLVGRPTFERVPAAQCQAEILNTRYSM